MKLWCFERNVGQLDLQQINDANTQMAMVVARPQDYDFFLQYPGAIVEHRGSYAHFVITFIRPDSPFAQWSALVGWEINTPSQVHRCMRVEQPLLAGKDGHLTKVADRTYLTACSRTVGLKYATFREQGDARSNFLEKQKHNSMQRVSKATKAKDSNASRFSGLKSRASKEIPKENVA